MLGIHGCALGIASSRSKPEIAMYPNKLSSQLMVPPGASSCWFVSVHAFRRSTHSKTWRTVQQIWQELWASRRPRRNLDSLLYWYWTSRGDRFTSNIYDGSRYVWNLQRNIGFFSETISRLYVFVKTVLGKSLVSEEYSSRLLSACIVSFRMPRQVGPIQ